MKKSNPPLVHFAAFKNHIGFYPGRSGVANFTKELTKYKTGTGSIIFPYGEKLPLALITRITKFRVKENTAVKKNTPKMFGD